jgi:TonB-dependent receptor
MDTQPDLRARLLVGAFATAGISWSITAPAQEQPKEAPLQEVVVSGFRTSLQKAAEIKRDSDVVADVISAEDIGKFPDQNLADSLQRITGVQITRTNGEGSRVSVRGLSPDFTQTLYNGRVITSPSGGRSFDFATLASDFVNAVEVSKTPSADMVDGGLAATVNIKTARALDIGKDRYSFTAEGVYEDKSEDLTPHVAAYMNKILTDQLGVTFGVNYQKRKFRYDSLRAFGFENGVEATRIPALDYNLDGDFGDTFRFNHEAGARVNLGDTERLTAIGGVQMKPTDNIDLHGDVLFSKYDVVLNQPTNTLRFTNIVCPSNCVKNSIIENGRVVYLDADGVDYRNGNSNSDTRNKTYSGALGATFDLEPFTVDTQVSSSQSKQLVTGLQMSVIGRASAYEDFRADTNLPQFGFTRGYDPLNAKNFRGIGLNGDYNRPTNDRNTDGRFDVTYDIDRGLAKSLRFGGLYGMRDQQFRSSRIVLSPKATAAALGVPFEPGVENGSFDASAFMTQYTFNDLFDGYDGPVRYPSTWLNADLNKLLAALPLDRLLALAPPSPNLATDYEVEEKISAGYLRFDFAALNDRLGGNMGVRFVRTDQTSSGYAPDLSLIEIAQGTTTTIPGVTPTSIERSYNDWLPSLNVHYNLTDDLIARFAVARVMSRPTLGTLSPSTTVNANVRTITINNPNVDPYLADQADLSLEYYLDNGGLLSTAVFYKDVKNFVVNTTRVETLNVTVKETGNLIQIPFTIFQPDNGAGAKLKGVELGMQMPFSFLPGFWSGFGSIVNYTYLDAGEARVTQNGPPLPLPGVSKSSYNVVGYYERGKFSGRLAYNYRSSFVVSTAANFGDGSYGQAYGQLDASFSYDINDHIGLTLEGLNLRNSVVRTQNDAGFGRGYENIGPRYTFGVRARF